MQIKDKVLDVPVIQGGMGVGVSLSSLAGAVAANGACGVISSVNAGYDEQDFKSNPFKANLRALDHHIKRAKQIAAESTKKGLVAVNIMTAVSHYEESCKTAVSAGADIIISGAGLPLNLPQFTKGTDTLAAPIVSSGRAARIIMKTYKKHYDVYPDMFIIECLNPEYSCVRDGQDGMPCLVHKELASVQRELESLLKRKTLQQIMEEA